MWKKRFRSVDPNHSQHTRLTRMTHIMRFSNDLRDHWDPGWNFLSSGWTVLGSSKRRNEARDPRASFLRKLSLRSLRTIIINLFLFYLENLFFIFSFDFLFSHSPSVLELQTMNFKTPNLRFQHAMPALKARAFVRILSDTTITLYNSSLSRYETIS